VKTIASSSRGALLVLIPNIAFPRALCAFLEAGSNLWHAFFISFPPKKSWRRPHTWGLYISFCVLGSYGMTLPSIYGLNEDFSLFYFVFPVSPLSFSRENFRLLISSIILFKALLVIGLLYRNVTPFSHCVFYLNDFFPLSPFSFSF
jgi:hypothetical protein